MENKLLTDRAALFIGDAAHVGDILAPDSVDAIVTDPPAGIGFMGAEWDSDKGGRDAWVAWLTDVMVNALRVLKPGGHALVWALPRTSHWTATALENAGFEVRDIVMHLFGTGFPKSLDVSKAIDKLDANEERRRRDLRFTAWMRSTGITSRQINTATGSNMGGHYLTDKEQPCVPTQEMFATLRPLLPQVPEWVEQLVAERTVESETFKRRPVVGERKAGINTGRGSTPFIVSNEANRFLTAPATDLAREWEGWGTALKPAAEHWILCRKPLSGTVATNVQQWRTGALNIDGCRIPTSDDRSRPDSGRKGGGGVYGESETYTNDSHAGGRWPANVTLDEHAAELLDAQSGVLTSGANPTRRGPTKTRNTYKDTFTGQESCNATRGEDSGGASRFYYVAKPSRAERDAGCDDLPLRSGGEATGRDDDSAGLSSPRAGAGRGGNVRNHHPTVKSIALMRWLCRLVTPPGGAVLDPFAGSGSTGVAALAEGFEFVGVERDPDYAEIAAARLRHALGVG